MLGVRPSWVRDGGGSDGDAEDGEMAGGMECCRTHGGCVPVVFKETGRIASSEAVEQCIELLWSVLTPHCGGVDGLERASERVLWLSCAVYEINRMV